MEQRIIVILIPENEIQYIGKRIFSMSGCKTTSSWESDCLLVCWVLILEDILLKSVYADIGIVLCDLFVYCFFPEEIWLLCLLSE